jgi:hypothetical protein
MDVWKREIAGIDKCWWCCKTAVCFYFYEDNGYIREAVCKECFAEAIRIIDKVSKELLA